LSDERSVCDSVEQNDNVIVISSDEDGEEKSSHSFNLHGSQPSSPLSISPCVTNPSSYEPDEEPIRVRLNALDQDDESQGHTKIFSAAGSEVEFAECNSDIHILNDSHADEYE